MCSGDSTNGLLRDHDMCSGDYTNGLLKEHDIFYGDSTNGLLKEHDMCYGDSTNGVLQEQDMCCGESTRRGEAMTSALIHHAKDHGMYQTQAPQRPHQVLWLGSCEAMRDW